MKAALSIVFLLISSVVSFGQADLEVVKQFAPEKYPPAARAVRAFGAVEVRVEVDFDGKVISAMAVTGHPLLRAVSESAAKKWLFTSTAASDVSRVATISFNFHSESQIRLIVESESSDQNVTIAEFLTPLAADIRTETLIPRLLLLTRENGKKKPKLCDRHNEVMDVEVREVKCPDDGQADNDGFERSETYNEAEDIDFPNANSADMGGCRNDGIERQEVHFCQACRISRSNWIQINR